MKILGFDSWTGGAFNFERLLPAFGKGGMTFTLVHLGSWGSDSGRPRQEMIGTLEARDISFYGEESFDRVLDIERPDAVILLSTLTFAHRAFMRYCRQRSIPTLHLYHGLSNVQVTNDSRGSHKIDRLAYAIFVMSKIGKLVRRTFPCYIAALLRTHANWAEWITFFSDVLRMAQGRPVLYAAEDARATKCAVYTSADIEHAVRIYGFNNDEVIAVGNPDLIRFGFPSAMLGMKNRQVNSAEECVMYLDQALAVVGLMFKSMESFIEHLIETSRMLARQGKRMAFKPHPAHDWKRLQNSLVGTEIELVSNDRFLRKLKECAACITEASSIAVLPALMGMPLLYAKYGELKEQRFGAVLTSYPRGYLLEDLSRVTEILNCDAKRFDSGAVNLWISRNAGPLPAEEMPQRVANIICDLVSTKRTERIVSFPTSS